ncbi:MAG TPA: pyridoxal kinase PdxY [Alphaproteobacteria bacterium]|nr:pyridoxal kinase PdxY [Alphaproteobacteria bacterium]
MNILSIQSHVAFGHVGNAAAVFPLQRLGLNVWPVHTVQFSNHTGYGDWGGAVLAPEAIASVIDGLDRRGALDRCDAVLTGYIGSAALGAVVADAVRRIKAKRPDCLYCCDPVMGDVGRGFYVPEAVAGHHRDTALPLADVLTPNAFELEFLAGAPVTDPRSALVAAQALRRRGPNWVLVTSLPMGQEDRVGLMLVGPDGAWRVDTPRLPIVPTGSGDATAALFMGHWLTGKSPVRALECAAGAIFGLLEATIREGGGELALVAAQNQLAQPVHRFEAQRV